MSDHCAILTTPRFTPDSPEAVAFFVTNRFIPMYSTKTPLRVSFWVLHHWAMYDDAEEMLYKLVSAYKEAVGDALDLYCLKDDGETISTGYVKSEYW